MSSDTSAEGYSFKELNADFIKENYLMGLNPMVGDKPVPDKFWTHWIRTSIRHIEKKAMIAIGRKKIKDEPHDYNVQDFVAYNFLQLYNRPVLSVESWSAVGPTSDKPWNFPKEWFRLVPQGGQLQLVSSLAMVPTELGFGGQLLPMMAGTVSYLPNFFRVTYTAGFEEDKLPEDIVDAIGKRVAIEVLAQMGDLLYAPGVSSISASIDGVSESMSIVNNGQLGAVFTSRISQYRKDLYGDPQAKIDGLISDIKNFYHGIGFVSL